VRLPILLVLAAAAVALVFAFRGCSTSPPIQPPTEAPAPPAPTPEPAAAPLPVEVPPPAAAERADAAPAPPPVPTPYTVTGVVLGDRRAPDLRGARVTAWAGQPGDETGSLFTAGLNPSAGMPAFVLRGEPIASTEVAADGTFVLRAPSRHLRLALVHDVYLLPVPEIVHVPSEPPRAEVVLTPLLGGCLRGRLLGDAAPRVERIRLIAEADPMSVMRDTRVFLASMTATSQQGIAPAADGTFVCRGVIPGSTLTVLAEGERAVARVDVPPLEPGEVREMVLPVQPAAELEVVVRDDAGAPIADAAIAARSTAAGGMLVALQSRRAKTGADGVATLRGLERQRLRVEATARGHTADTAEFDLLAATEDKPRLEFVLGRGGTVQGIVVDPSGAPVADARVAHQPGAELPMLGDLASQLGHEQMAAVAEGGTRTDAQGRFELTGLADDGTFLVVAAHPDHAAAAARGVRMGDREVRVQLGQLGGVQGRAVAAEDGARLVDAQVALLRTSFLVLTVPVREEPLAADGDGSFRFERIAPGTYTLRVRAADRSDTQVEVTVRDGITDAGELRLPRAAVVTGVVVDDQDRPVLGALVRRRQGAMADNPMLVMFTGGGTQARTDADGRFRLGPLPPGRLQLLANADGFASGRSERLQLTAGDTVADVRIVLDHGGSIQGTVRTGPGQRPDEFLLMAQEQTTQTTRTTATEPDGTFTFTDLDPGQWTVQAMPRELMQSFGQQEVQPGQGMKLGETLRKVTDAVVSQRCAVRAGETTTVELDTGDLAVGATWRLVVEVGGTVLRDGVVEATGDDGRVRVALLDAGAATFGCMQPGNYVVQARTGLSMTPVGTPQSLVFPADVDEHRTTLTLPGGELRGRVVDAGDGRPLRAVLVRLLHEGAAERDDSVGTAISDADGSFVFRGLGDGNYGLLAVDGLGTGSSEGSSRLDGITVSTAAPTAPVELRARAAGSATVLVTTGSGAPVSGATVLCVDAEGRPLGGRALATTGTDGRAAFGGLPAGTARVVGRAPGFAPGASATQPVEPGQAVAFALTLGNGTRTMLHVVDRDGRPVLGTQITARCADGPWLPAMLLLDGSRGDGTFDLGRLGAGSWEFRASHPTFGSRTATRVLNGTGSATVVLSP
jgi:hypothetical protein